MRHVVITAGASGLGRAMAERFMTEGDSVAICDADPNAVAAFSAAYPAAIACVADVTDEAQMQAFFDQIDAADFVPTGRVTEPMLKMLRQRSAERVAVDEEFLELADDIARYEKRKQDKTISLLESDFAKQWNEGKAAEEEEEEKQEKDAGPRRPVVTRDFYFDEAMRITADYLAALAGGIPGLAQSETSSVAP